MSFSRLLIPFANAVCCFALVVGFVAATVGGAEPTEVATVPAQVVGGVVVVRGVLHSPQGDLQANFILDLGSAHGLTVPPERARALGLDAGKMASLTVGTLALPTVTVREHEVAEVTGPVTTDHAAELSQIPAIGVLGLGAFDRQTISLDLGAQALRVGPAPADVADGTVTLPFPATGSPVFTLNDLRVGLGMLQYESLVAIDEVDALHVGLPNAARVALGATNLLESDAFRPAKLVDATQPVPALMLGVRFLADHRVTINPSAGMATFVRVRPAAVVTAEQAYFLARHRRDAKAVATFLEQNPEHRLVNEAALELLQMQLSSGASGDETMKTVRALATSFPVQRRSSRLIALADELMRQPDERFALVVHQMLDLASETAKDDIDPRAIHQAHAREGVLALRAGDLTKARRLLLSAAYGARDDARINEWMGDLYLKTSQPTRAWARYVDAALAQGNTSVTVMRALDALHRDISFRTTLPIEDIELMLEGRAPSFAPPRPRSAETMPSVALVELFTDDAAAGSVGPQLAFDGLRQYCHGTPVVFLAHHFGPAGNTSASSRRARFYGRTKLPAIVADGQPISEAAGGPQDAMALFENALARIAPSTSTTKPLSIGVALDVKSTWIGDQIETVLQANNGASVDAKQLRLFVFLAERRVFAIGGNGIAMHYNVVRTELGDPMGNPLKTGETTQNWTFFISKEQMASAIALADDARSRQSGNAPAMRTTIPDLAECNLVAFIQDVATRQVLAATSLRIGPVEPTR